MTFIKLEGKQNNC